MLGFVVGSACLIGFLVLLHRGRRARYRHRVLRRLLRDLRATPQQEEVVEAGWARIREAVFALRKRSANTLQGGVSLFRAADFDREQARRLLDGHLVEVERLRDVLVDSLDDLHKALDPDQRMRLSRHLERMSVRRARPVEQHPYRSPEVNL